AEEKVYARFGGRDASGPDSKQTLAALRYTMESVLQMHRNAEKAYAPRPEDSPRSIREVTGFRFGRGCMHCHNVKEAINDDLRRKGKWERDMAWKYPPPDNLGLALEVDRGNVVKEVKANSPAALAGMKAGDVVQLLNRMPVHSFADAQFALDRAPKTGAVEVAWKRGDKVLTEKLSLPEGWRKSDITWRPSVHHLVPSVPVFGEDLTEQEKKALGLSAAQLAFRQKESVAAKAHAIGIRGGDIILGVDDKVLETDVIGFIRHVERNYLIGD